MIHVNMVCLSQFPSPTALAPPEGTSEIVQESSHTNSASDTTQQELATAEGKFSLNSVSH